MQAFGWFFIPAASTGLTWNCRLKNPKTDLILRPHKSGLVHKSSCRLINLIHWLFFENNYFTITITRKAKRKAKRKNSMKTTFTTAKDSTISLTLNGKQRLECSLTKTVEWLKRKNHNIELCLAFSFMNVFSWWFCSKKGGRTCSHLLFPNSITLITLTLWFTQDWRHSGCKKQE